MRGGFGLPRVEKERLKLHRPKPDAGRWAQKLGWFLRASHQAESLSDIVSSPRKWERGGEGQLGKSRVEMLAQGSVAQGPL